MDRDMQDQLRELFRLFLVYESIEQRSAAGHLHATEMADLTLILRDLSFRCWGRVFGPVLASPAHRRFALEWCARNAELLMKEEVLPVIAYQVVADHIRERLREVGEVPPGYDFSHQGPPGPEAQALRRIYLVQALTIQFEELAGSRQIPARLQGQLRRLLIRRAKGLFAQMVPAEALATGTHPIEAYVRRGVLAPAEAERLAAALGLKLGPVSAPPPPPASDPLLEIAAAAEMMKRLRRAPALSTAERDRLIRMVEAELDGLMQGVDARTVQRALQAMAERVGIPVPPAGPAAPHSKTSSVRGPRPVAPMPTPAAGPHAARPPKPEDAAEFQWAFDLVDELRRDGVEGEK